MIPTAAGPDEASPVNEEYLLGRGAPRPCARRPEDLESSIGPVAPDGLRTPTDPGRERQQQLVLPEGVGIVVEPIVGGRRRCVVDVLVTVQRVGPLTGSQARHRPGLRDPACGRYEGRGDPRRARRAVRPDPEHDRGRRVDDRLCARSWGILGGEGSGRPQGCADPERDPTYAANVRHPRRQTGTLSAAESHPISHGLTLPKC